MGRHGCALVKDNGTRYLGLSPRGEIAKSPWARINRSGFRLSTGEVKLFADEPDVVRNTCAPRCSDLASDHSGIKQAPRQTAHRPSSAHHSTCRGLRMDDKRPVFSSLSRPC